MNQLIFLLNVLVASELNKLKKLRLIGKERMVYDYIFARRLKDLAHTNQICEDLEITPTHFYKICSVLTDKIYDILVPERGFTLLNFLLKKMLVGHFKHELLMQEKLLLKANSDKSILMQFYYKSYILLLDISSQYFDESLLESYGNKYLEFRENCSIGDKLFVRNSFFSSELLALKTTLKSTENAKNIHAQLLENQLKLEADAHVFAQFYLNKSLAIYADKFQNNASDTIYYFKKNIELIEENKDVFDSNHLVDVKSKIAEVKYKSRNYLKAISIYEQLYSIYSYQLLSNTSTFTYFCELLILTEKYDFAFKSIQAKYFNFNEGKNLETSVIGFVLLVKLYLIQDDFEKVSEAFASLKKIISKTETNLLEVETKTLESIYYLLIHDFKSAKSILKKTNKLLTTSNNEFDESVFETIYNILQALFKSDHTTKPLPKKYLKQIEQMNHCEHKIYGTLMSKVLEVAKNTEISD